MQFFFFNLFVVSNVLCVFLYVVKWYHVFFFLSVMLYVLSLASL